MQRIIFVFVVSIFVSACKGKSIAKVSNAESGDTLATAARPVPPRPSLKVTARLIYEDGSLSDFDILNDKSIALWNTIIGGGDAMKPSTSTKLSVSGGMDSLHLRIKDGRRMVLDTIFMLASDSFDYVIRNTGCEKLQVNIARDRKVIYNDTIPFYCGE